MVGADPFGQEIRRIVGSHGEGLTGGLVTSDQAASSYTVIINPPGIDRIFLHHPGTNDTLGASDIDYDVVAKARLFHFGYPPLMRRFYEKDGAELATMFRRIKEMGVTTSLDMAIPDASSPAGRVDWAALLRQVLPYVDIFLPSIEESLFMLRRDAYFDLMAAGEGGVLDLVSADMLTGLSGELLGLGAKIAGFKLGHRGFYVRTGPAGVLATMGAAKPASPEAWACKEIWAPVFVVDVVGTTGAGDATIAGFLTALLRGLSVEDAATAAVAVGACNVEAADALGGVRPWDETWRRVRAGWPRRRLAPEPPGWRYDEGNQHWSREGECCE
jgi:sugar/nucleoside kinase (ribokinase family)